MNVDVQDHRCRLRAVVDHLEANADLHDRFPISMAAAPPCAMRAGSASTTVIGPWLSVHLVRRIDAGVRTRDGSTTCPSTRARGVRHRGSSEESGRPAAAGARNRHDWPRIAGRRDSPQHDVGIVIVRLAQPADQGTPIVQHLDIHAPEGVARVHIDRLTEGVATIIGCGHSYARRIARCREPRDGDTVSATAMAGPFTGQPVMVQPSAATGRPGCHAPSMARAT